MTKVLVIGGGIAGYCAALAARRDGAEVTVVARAPGATALYAGGMEVIDDLDAVLAGQAGQSGAGVRGRRRPARAQRPARGGGRRQRGGRLRRCVDRTGIEGDPWHRSLPGGREHPGLAHGGLAHRPVWTAGTAAASAVGDDRIPAGVHEPSAGQLRAPGQPAFAAWLASAAGDLPR